MFTQILTIARNTFTESIRQPVYVVLILLGTLALLITPSVSAYSLTHGQDNKMLVEMGLSMVALTVIFMAAFTATGVLAEEVENKTVLTVVSKPVARPIFVIGKYFGVAAAMLLAFYILSIVFLMLIRHRVMQTASDHFDQPVFLFGIGGGLLAMVLATLGNYLYRWVFTAAFVKLLAVVLTFAFAMILLINKDWEFQSPLVDIQADHGRMGLVMAGLVVVAQIVLILTAIAVACSTRIGQLPTLIICLVLFLVGLVTNSFSEYVNQWAGLSPTIGVYESIPAIWSAELEMHTKSLYLVVKMIYFVFPNLQFLWPADAIAQENPMTIAYVGKLTAYATLQIVAILCIAVVMFQKREVG